jgi:hypothetical protein
MLMESFGPVERLPGSKPQNPKTIRRKKLLPSFFLSLGDRVGDKGIDNRARQLSTPEAR